MICSASFAPCIKVRTSTRPRNCGSVTTSCCSRCSVCCKAATRLSRQRLRRRERPSGASFRTPKNSQKSKEPWRRCHGKAYLRSLGGSLVGGRLRTRRGQRVARQGSQSDDCLAGDALRSVGCNETQWRQRLHGHLQRR